MENTSGFHPIEDRVLVKMVELEEKTSGGIVLPQSTKDAEGMAAIQGHLVEAGDEATARLDKYGIKPGQLILYAKYSGEPLTGVDGVRYRIMNAIDVIGWSDSMFDTKIRGRNAAPLYEMK